MRNYEVSIDGLAVVLTQHAPEAAPQAGGLVVQAAAEGVDELVERARRIPGVERLTLVVPDAAAAWDGFRSTCVPVDAAGGAVTDERGRLLVIHRLGRWDLPKGKVDAGEALPEAAVREVKEECGLREVRIVRPLCDTWHTYERGGERHLKRTSWFLMRASSAKRLVPQHEEDIHEVAWMDADGVQRVKAGTYATVRAVISAWEEAVPRSRT